MKTYKTIIVDDEAHARDMIRELLNRYPEIDIQAEAENVEQALKAIVDIHPDIVFLDIDLPPKNGFDLVKELKEYQIETTIVFITAFNQFAIDAIKCAAFDYIMKPVLPEELDKCILRFKTQKSTQTLSQQIDKLTHCIAPEKLRFNTRTGFVMIDPRDIVYCEADGNYTKMFLENGKNEYVSVQIGKIEELLSDLRFVRANRSVLINMNFIQTLNRLKGLVILGHKKSFYEIKLNRGGLKKLGGY